ncbi:hypothetical protein VNO78_17389 [Psophocarpus tetragonolobus]|uniref:Uncharacterized protein n=1 Tax=Psophocarpus tetragonolobus TaxID=3891 RepID=A0AAN9XKP0_PSOTE
MPHRHASCHYYASKVPTGQHSHGDAHPIKETQLGPTAQSHGFVPIEIQRFRIHSQKATASEPSGGGPRLSLSLAVSVPSV